VELLHIEKRFERLFARHHRRRAAKKKNKHQKKTKK